MTEPSSVRAYISQYLWDTHNRISLPQLLSRPDVQGSDNDARRILEGVSNWVGDDYGNRAPLNNTIIFGVVARRTATVTW
jgi:hypothetical protein